MFRDLNSFLRVMDAHYDVLTPGVSKVLDGRVASVYGSSVELGS